VKLTQIQAFLAICESGSIRRAARQLNVSQSNLTKIVRQLEDELSAPLLLRSARGVTPTNYGRALIPRAKVIESEVQRAKNEIRQIQGFGKGVISIGVSASPALMLVSKALTRFWRRFPDVRVHVVDGAYDPTLADLRDGRLDFSIVPIELVPAARELQTELLMESVLVPIVRKGHPLQNAKSLKDLAQASWVLSGSATAPVNVLEATFVKHGLKAPRVQVQCESFPALMSLATGTDLIGVLPKRFVEMPPFEAVLKAIPIKEHFLPSRAVLLTRADVPMTPIAQALAKDFRLTAKVLGLAPGDSEL
jgi:LysR family transcriptional regulator, regulator of abg operon